MILDWFNTTEVDALADRLARDLVKRSPPSTQELGKKGEARLSKVRDAVLREAGDFASKHPLNVYKKARLANRLKWALHEAGYPKSTVDELAFELASVVATARKR
jgi:hypothetical protein